MPSRASFVARWSPRIGRKAARLYVLTGPTTTIGIWSAPIWLVLFLVGDRWSRICAYVVAGVGFACLAFASLSLHLMYRALTERFGFKVSWRNAPPYRYKAFGAWCRKHGLDPNAGRPVEGERDEPPAPRRPTERGPSQRSPAHRARSHARK
jgi:MFS family permease